MDALLYAFLSASESLYTSSLPLISWWQSVLTPMVEICIWGLLTVMTYFFTIYMWLDSEERQRVYNTLVAAVINVIWTINVTSWMSHNTHWTILSDGLMVALCLTVFVMIKKRWAIILAFLYSMSVGLDYAYLEGFNFTAYARWSNLVYLFQLVTVSGVFSKKTVNTLVLQKTKITT